MTTDGRKRAASDASPVALRAVGVSKAFEATQALDGAELEVRGGQVHALLGTNGCGKSTLIKILAGVFPADAGTLELNGVEHSLTVADPSERREAHLRFVHQQPTVFPDLSVADNLGVGQHAKPISFRRLRHAQIREETEEILAGFRIDARPDSRLGDLRLATQTMIAIARALHSDEGSDERVLILDEPTAKLPPSETQVLFEALSSYAEAGQTILLVTHRMDEVIGLADVATILRDGKTVGTVDREEFSKERLAEMIVGRPLETYFPEHLAPRKGVPTLGVRGLSGEQLAGVDFDVFGGEVVGLAGLEGSGSSSVLRLLFGVEGIEGGTIGISGTDLEIGSPRDAIRAGIAYVPADRTADGIFPDLTVRANLSAATVSRYKRVIGMRRAAEVADATADIERFNIIGGQSPLMNDLSGGNQQKAVVARWLRRSPKLLLLDDPTQGVDIGARAELWGAIDSAIEDGAAVLIHSSDHEELIHVADRILVFQSGRIVAELNKDSMSSDSLAMMVQQGGEVAA